MKVAKLLIIKVAFFFYLSAFAATQYINQNAPNVLEVSVQDDTTPAAYVQQPNGRQYQYFNQTAWSSVIWLNGSEVASSYSSTYNRGSATAFTPTSNISSGSGTTADPWVITTIVSLGATGVNFTQTITYVDGDRYIGKTFTIENTSGSNFTDVRFFHGGDTYFGGDDAARSWWDNANKMIYVNNSDFVNQGIMGFYANAATPADHYFGGGYSTGNTHAHINARLPDTADSSYVDAGYYLEWDKATLAAGETWTILSYETWSEPTFLQVIAPANDYVQPGTTINRLFKVHNLNTDAKEISLTLTTAPNNWTATLPNGSTINAAGLAVVEVPVQITIPAGAANGTIETINLEAEASEGETVVTGDSDTRLTVTSLDVSISPNPANFGVINVGNSSDETITFRNNSGADVTLGTVNTSSTDFSIFTDNASGQTIANGGTATIVLRFTPTAEVLRNGTVNWPMTSPFVTNLTSTATGGQEVSDDPEPPADPQTPDPVYQEFTHNFSSNSMKRLGLDLDPNNILTGTISTSIVSGSIPNRLKIDGTQLVGWPQTLGTHNFTISQTSGINEVRNIIQLKVMEPTIMPVISGIWLNDVYHEINTTQSPTHGVPAKSDLFTTTIDAGSALSIYFDWDYIKDSCSFIVVEDTELPEGLYFKNTTYNGLPTAHISGTVTTPGDYLFLVSVKDWRGRGFQWIRLIVQ